MDMDSKLKLAKENWEEAKKSAAIEKECFDLFIKAKDELLKSFHAEGFQPTEAVQQVEELLNEHYERYKETVKHRSKMDEIFKKLLEEVENTCS